MNIPFFLLIRLIKFSKLNTTDSYEILISDDFSRDNTSELVAAFQKKNPQKNIPIAILGAVLVGFILYFMLQLSFLMAVPQSYLQQGWHQLSFPGDSGPLVGLSLLLGLSVVAVLLLFDAAFSPLGTTLVYTAATSRILYGMALNKHLPPYFLKIIIIYR